MTVRLVGLDRDALTHEREYEVHTQRLHPWAVLNSPFESAWVVVRARTHSTLHSHHEHEIFVAVRGEAVVECDGERSPFRTGDVVFFPPGSRHRVLNDGPEDFEFYSVWWDHGLAQRFIAGDEAEVRS